MAIQHSYFRIQYVIDIDSDIRLKRNGFMKIISEIKNCRHSLQSRAVRTYIGDTQQK